MKFKKSIALSLCMVIFCTLVAGCAKKPPEESSVPTTGSVTTVGSETTSPEDVLTPISHTDLYAVADTLALGTQFPVEERHSHGPTVVELPDGELFAVWFSAAPSGERDTNECRILGARSSDGGDSWTKPFEVYNLSGIPSNNPVIYLDSSNRLWVFFCTILNGQWVSAIPRYMYADAGSYESSAGYTGNPDWHYPEPLYVLAGDSYDGEGRWDEQTKSVVYDSGDKTHIRYVSEEVAAKLDPSEYVKVDARANPEDMKSEVIDTKYITDSFVVAIRNQVETVVAYLEKEKPYDDEFVQRNDHVIQCVNEGYFREEDDPAGYKSEPSLKDGAIQRASGADNNMDLWNPAYRRMGWQTKNQPIEITVPAGETLSDGTVAGKDTNRLLLPLYSDSLALSIMAYTDDGGKTWGYSNPIAGLGNIQGALIQKDDGTIYQYFRTGKLDGKNDRLDWKTPRAESHDYGITWENQYVEPYLRNDGGFGITKLADGTWVMVHNQDPGTDLRSGTRKSVTLSYSRDEGESWQSIMLETDRLREESNLTGPDAGTGAYTKLGYQYPGIIQLRDGSLLAIYQNSDRGEADKVIRTAKIENLDDLLEVKLTLDKTASNLKVGATETLTASETYQGKALEDDSLLFRTTNADVLTVSEDGVVTAVAEGVAKVLVSSGKYGAIAECLYTVAN